MKNVNIITRKAKRDIADEIRRNGFANIRGQLEVVGSKNGKVFYYDKGDNQVTIWAKHATMHLLTNENFTSHGRQRSFEESDHINAEKDYGDPGEGVNNDGTLLSGQQYFADNEGINIPMAPQFNLDYRWSKSTIDPSTALGDLSSDPDDMKFPFAPTKMIFGTGFEWESWQAVEDYDTANTTTYANTYANQAYPGEASDFDVNIDNANNDYSATWTGTGNDLTKTRTMNDIFSASLTTPTITDQDFAIKGAIKNGFYTNSDTQRGVTGYTPADQKTEEDGNGNEFLIPAYAGVGNPSFIYPTRERRFFETGSEVALAFDQETGAIGDIENKITFQVVMPEQTGKNAGIFYPYNGYMLKEAGLFCDARLLLQNTLPTEPGTEEDLYTVMPYGIMYAKRYISPITKSHDVSITSRWTLFL